MTSDTRPSTLPIEFARADLIEAVRTYARDWAWTGRRHQGQKVYKLVGARPGQSLILLMGALERYNEYPRLLEERVAPESESELRFAAGDR